MKTLTTNSALTILAGLMVLVALAVWWTGGFKNLGGSARSQVGAVAAVDLTSAANFAVLAGASVVDANLSVIVGDVGLSPASASFIGLTCPEITGTIYGVDAAFVGVCFAGNPPLSNKTLVDNAKIALTAAYTNAANETPATTLAGSDNQLGSKVLTPGIYTFSSAATANLIGALTLDAQGDPNAVFVFQTASSLVTDSASSVLLLNGAQACNVFWQVGSSATFGTGTQFVGTVMADQSITDAGGSTISGRLLARSATVTLNNTHVTVPTCSTAPTLRVIKHVINDNAGTSVASAWTLSVTSSNGGTGTGSAAGAESPGTTYTLEAGKAYSVAESGGPGGYDMSASADCTIPSAGTGVTYTCTITNNDTTPAPAASGGGSSGAADVLVVPLISVTKVPTPLALPSGPGLVTYIYTVTNIGPVAMNQVWVTDDTCSPATYISGDANNDSKLDKNEAWVYRCMQTVSKTVTNTAKAHGQAGGWDTYDTALATVVVGEPVTPPLITIVKVPSRLTPFPFGGGNVTYTYTVKNPGIVAMHDVTVTDDKCTSVSFVSGDTDGNSLLEPSEAWTYSCATHISASTSNTATAKGMANGFTATDYAYATVLVSAPGLPNTGLPPRQ